MALVYQEGKSRGYQTVANSGLTPTQVLSGNRHFPWASLSEWAAKLKMEKVTGLLTVV